MSYYASCQANLLDDANNASAMMECLSNQMEESQAARDEDLKAFLFVLAGAMIFFMQSGFAMVCAGAVRIKNVQNTMLKNLLDACGAAVAFFLVGNAFAFGGQLDTTATTFVGLTEFASIGPSAPFWFFEYTFSATSVTIVAGTLAERCQMVAYLCYSMFLAGIIYPVVAHALWSNNGFISNFNADPFMGSGAIDFAGSGVVHLTGGITALFATIILGPRRGRFYDAQGMPLPTPKPFPGHSIALQLLGTMVLWFGWFGFNPGSALLLSGNVGEIAANAAVSTALAGASGGIAALFTNLFLEERRTGEPHFSLVMAMNGSLSGLVAITAGCALVEPWAALVIGIVSGWIYIWSSALLIKLRIDDAVDAIPVHMFNGIWGMIATGIFASPDKMEMTYGVSAHVGVVYSWARGSSDAALLACQTLACLFIIGWTLVTVFPFFVWLNYKGWLRSDSLEELVGLDISYHGGSKPGQGEGVRKEYVEAYRRQKNSRSRAPNTTTTSGDDSEQWMSSAPEQDL